jgi:hypothetical protein
LDAARVHAAAAERDLGAAADCGSDHAFEVVVAVGGLLAGERAGDGVGEQEDPHFFALAFGE